MSTREIPRDEWMTFFDSFSRRYEGWLVTVEMLGDDIGAQVEVRELPLVGIVVDLKGSDEAAISIIIGEEAQDHITHTITQPTHVRFEETGEAEHMTLQIEPAGGATTLVNFFSLGSS